MAALPTTEANLPLPLEQRQGAIVLVHGAWVGEWSWLPIEAGLRASGRPVHAVSLTGHGARSHQSGPEVSLSHHVADVVGLVETLDLVDITLVGHSYGGRVTTKAVTTIADRISSLVYLDAHTPVTDDPGQPEERVATAAANGGMLAFDETYAPDVELLGSARAVEWFRARTMPQSFACLTEPWLTEIPARTRKTFVFATGYEPSRFLAYAEICRADSTWAYHELDGDHFLMMSHPAEVTDIILNA